MISLLNKTNDFRKNDKGVIEIINLLLKNLKGLVSGKKKGKACFGDKDLSSWIGLGGPDMSEVRVLVQFRTFRIQNQVFDEMSR